MTIKKLYITQFAYRLARILLPSLKYLLSMFRNTRELQYFPHWLVSNIIPNKSSLSDEVPWVTYDAIRWFKSYITTDMVVYEYGSGGSTLFFSQNANKVTSIEHNPEWFKKVDSILKQKNLLNCEYSLVVPEKSQFLSPLCDALPISTVVPDADFTRYVKSIHHIPDNSLDILFVDGRARNCCIAYSRSKLRPGGCLILDNSERAEYEAGKQLLHSWPRLYFSGHGPYSCEQWQTTVWFCPK